MGTEKAGANSVASSIAPLLTPILALYKQNIDKMVQPFGISVGQSTLMILLGRRDGQSQTELARQLGVTPPSLTTMLNRMEKAGLLERRKNGGDRRTSKVYLSAKGRKAGKKMNAVIRFVNERSLAGFRSEEKILFLRFLEQMMANLEKQRGELLLIAEDEARRKENPEKPPGKTAL